MLGVWRKVPECDARSLDEDAGMRCSEFGGRCRNAMLGVWRKVPENDAGSAHAVLMQPPCLRDPEVSAAHALLSYATAAIRD